MCNTLDPDRFPQIWVVQQFTFKTNKMIKGMRCMISELYNMTFLIARRLEKRFPSNKVSGDDRTAQTFWDYIPELLGEYGDQKFSRWNPELQPPLGTLYMMFTEKVMKLPEKFITGAGDEIIDHKNHCMIEIFRLPMRAEPTVANVLKIAFCNGRLMAHLRASDFPEGLIKAYKDFQMDRMINYVDPAEYIGIELPDTLLPDIKSRLLSEFKHVVEELDQDK